MQFRLQPLSQNSNRSLFANCLSLEISERFLKPVRRYVDNLCASAIMIGYFYVSHGAMMQTIVCKAMIRNTYKTHNFHEGRGCKVVLMSS